MNFCLPKVMNASVQKFMVICKPYRGDRDPHNMDMWGSTECKSNAISIYYHFF
jgi:hypothetical protein